MEGVNLSDGDIFVRLPILAVSHHGVAPLLTSPVLGAHQSLLVDKGPREAHHQGSRVHLGELANSDLDRCVDQVVIGPANDPHVGEDKGQLFGQGLPLGLVMATVEGDSQVLDQLTLLGRKVFRAQHLHLAEDISRVSKLSYYYYYYYYYYYAFFPPSRLRGERDTHLVKYVLCPVDHLDEVVVDRLIGKAAGCPEGPGLEDAQLDVDEGVDRLGHEPRSVQPGELLHKGVKHSLTKLALLWGDGVAEENGGAGGEQHEVVELGIVDEPLQHHRPIIEEEVAVLNSLPILDLGVRLRGSGDELGRSRVCHLPVELSDPGPPGEGLLTMVLTEPQSQKQGHHPQAEVVEIVNGLNDVEPLEPYDRRRGLDAVRGISRIVGELGVCENVLPGSKGSRLLLPRERGHRRVAVDVVDKLGGLLANATRSGLVRPEIFLGWIVGGEREETKGDHSRGGLGPGNLETVLKSVHLGGQRFQERPEIGLLLLSKPRPKHQHILLLKTYFSFGLTSSFFLSAEFRCATYRTVGGSSWMTSMTGHRSEWLVLKTLMPSVEPMAWS